MVQYDIVQCRELLAKKVIGKVEWSTATGPAILDEGATTSNPTILPNKADLDTGLGWPGGNTLGLVAGSVAGIQLKSAASHIVQTVDANTGLTADAGSAQGSGIILSSYNVYDTVGGAGDAATLPAIFGVGTIIFIKNGAAANSMDIFPASGDDLGAGVNTVMALAAGDFAVFIGTTANAVWEKLMGGTA